ncbi:MAG: hypothetical protein AMXMBFR84_06940 [Candidatus Hydrogenedentota bacterium]
MMPHSPGLSDSLVVINGPEDGAEFPVVRAPLVIGEDPHCDICVRLDRAVEERHAMISVVSEGYRVRKLGRTPVFVNGKKAGALKSRIAHNGSTIQVGHTLFSVECVPDGLANRSRGMVAESDFGWAVRQSGSALISFVRGFFDFLFRLFGRMTSSWLLIVAILIIVMAISPTVRAWAGYFIRYALYYANLIVSRVFS